MNVHTEEILGYKVNNLGIKSLVIDVIKIIIKQDNLYSTIRCHWLACINPHSFAVSLKDLEFSRALKDADWLIPDGAGIILASNILGGKIQERVTGSDIFIGVHEALNHSGNHSVFFLGATEQTLNTIQARMAVDYPNVRVAGTYSPPFKPDYSEQELEVMIKTINDAAPDILWVGLSAPKQEKWIFKNKSRLKVKFIGAIGAVFDFYSGNVRRSPVLFQRIGLEWLPRLVQQPARLWKRTFISAPIFLWHVLKIKIRRL